MSDLAHRIAEALEAGLPDGVVLGEAERAIIRRVVDPEIESLRAEVRNAQGNPILDDDDDVTSFCDHCQRHIVLVDGRWIDPAAPIDSDDAIWRETCERNDTFTAEHEPEA